MSNVHALTNDFNGRQLDLIRRTVAADCNVQEFDLFIAAAQRAGLDPFRKQISAIVFSKSDAKKRKMSIITTIDGLRTIADRSRQYRPDEDEPDYTYDPDEKSPTNPLGLVKAKVRIWKGDKPVTGVAYWTEFAPVKEEWAEGEDGRRRPTGKMTIESGNWTKMPRVMLAKCAEAQALRKAFPEDLSGLYEGAEMDQATASEIVGEYQTGERLTRIGAGVGITFQMFPDTALEQIGVGSVADRVLEALEPTASLKHYEWFASVNRVALQEFWARAPGDALELKKRMEAIEARLRKAEAA